MADLHTFTLSSGRTLAYAEYGAADGQEALFYFHGWPSSRLQGALLDQLGKELGIRVIAPDRPGIGSSDPQPGRTLLNWPPVVEELADHLGIGQFYVCGVSGGGPYTLATAYALPQRVKGASVICGAPPLAELGVGQMMWPYRLMMVVRKRAPMLLDGAFRMAVGISRQPRSGMLMRTLIRSLCAEDRRALSLDNNYDVVTSSFQQSLGKDTAALREDGDLYSKDWGFDPVDITVPLSFSHGALDSNIPLKMVKPYISRLPGVELKVYPNDGHYALPLLRSRDILKEMMMR